MVNPFGYAAHFGMNYDLCGLEDTLDREHNLVSTPLEGCQDLFVHEGSSSLSYENVLPNPLSMPIFLLLVHHLHRHPLSILMMCPMIFLNSMLLMLI